MRLLFALVWLGCLSFVLWCQVSAQPALAVALDPGDFFVLSLTLLLAPLGCGPGLLMLLRRMKSGGVNLPHAAYWFEGERRAASLERLAPYVYALSALVALFIAGMLALDVWHGQQGLRTPDAWHLLATAVFIVAILVWTFALVRAFPAPLPTKNAHGKPR